MRAARGNHLPEAHGCAGQSLGHGASPGCGQPWPKWRSWGSNRDPRRRTSGASKGELRARACQG
eukprot:2545728-Alexandrium_andersonii.AAC.1